MVMVFTCQQPGCQAVTLYPRAEFARCTPAFRDQILAATTAAGWHLAEDADPALEHWRGPSRSSADWPTMNDPDGRSSLVGTPRRHL
jgi:hypothetical protein